MRPNKIKQADLQRRPMRNQLHWKRADRGGDQPTAPTSEATKRQQLPEADPLSK